MSASFAANVRAWLLAQAPIVALVAGRAHHQAVPATYSGPYLWFVRRRIEQDHTFGETPGGGPWSQTIDLEAHSVDESHEAIADLVLGLSTYRGAFGAGSVQALFVRDCGEDYVARGLMGPEALQWSALQIEIIGYEG